MLESIFSGLTSGIAGGLDFIVQWLLSMLSFDMERPLLYMPAIATFYDILQWVALGLIGGIAVFQLGKFFFGNLSESKDSPIRILIRSALAAGLIYVGNYGLQIIFDLFSYPMNAMLDVSVTMPGSLFAEIVKVSFVAASTGLAGILINLILICALGWNILKLLLEAVERWLMLCVLTYTSPLAYATVASQATHEIFRKFLSMVMGQSVLLLANVWSVKLIINILAGIDMTMDPGKMLFGFVVAFAFARIAQKIDSYLQQLGVNAATTGGSLLDTLAAVGSVGGSLFGGGKQKSGPAGTAMGAIGNAMGDAMKSGNVVKGAMFGGGFGAAAAAVGKAIRKGADGAGMTAGDYVKSKLKSAASGTYDKATEAMGASHPNGADAMRRTKETASSMMHSGNDARETARNAGLAAAEKAVREGKTLEEAKEAGMNAYDKALKENAPLGAKTSGMFANTSKNMDARQEFAKDIAPAIDKMQNGASRMYVDSNGVVHNGFGKPQPDAVGQTSPQTGSTDHSSAAQPNTAPTKSAMGAENPLDPNAAALRDALNGKQHRDSVPPVQNPNKPQDNKDASVDPNVAAMQEAANNGTLMNADGSPLNKDTDPDGANALAGVEQSGAGKAEIDPNAAALHEKAEEAAGQNPDDELVPPVQNPYAEANMDSNGIDTADATMNGAAIKPGNVGEDTASSDPNAATDSKIDPNAKNETKTAGARVMDATKNPTAGATAAVNENAAARPGNVAQQTTASNAGTAKKDGTVENGNGKTQTSAIGPAGTRVLNAVGQQTSSASAQSGNTVSSGNAVDISGAATQPGNVAKQTMDNGIGINSDSEPTADSAGARVLNAVGQQSSNSSVSSGNVVLSASPVDTSDATTNGASPSAMDSAGSRVLNVVEQQSSASSASHTNPAPTPSGNSVGDSSASAAQVSSTVPSGMSGGIAESVTSESTTVTDNPDSAGERVRAAAAQFAQTSPAPTMQGPSSMVARAIAGSANSSAAEAGMGFSEYVRNPDPNAYTTDGNVAPGYSAQVLSQGTELALNTIEERGAEVADSIIQSDAVVDNQAVAAATFQHSSFMSAMDTDVAQSFAAMERTGIVPAARDAVPDQGIEAVPDRGSVTDMKVGKGVSEFTYEAPVTTNLPTNGQPTVSAPERITVRTSTAFSSLPTQEQSLYRAAQTESGDTFYVKRVPVSDHTSTAYEHHSKEGAKRSSSSAGHGANGNGAGRHGSNNNGSDHGGFSGNSKGGSRKPKNRNRN